MSEVKVRALIYKVKCDPRFDYDHAQPLCFTTQDFTCSVSAGRARFELATTCPTVEKAREIVDPFAESWTTKAELAHQPGTFKLIFHGAEIIDSAHPELGPQPTVWASYGGWSATANAHISIAEYPEPPINFAISDELRLLYEAWRSIWDTPRFKPALGYLLLTVLEGLGTPISRSAKPSKKRADAARMYSIELDVLEELGRLTSDRGGPHARKVQGLSKPMNQVEQEKQLREQRLLNTTILRLLCRLGEYNSHLKSTVTLTPITLDDINKTVP